VIKSYTIDEETIEARVNINPVTHSVITDRNFHLQVWIASADGLHLHFPIALKPGFVVRALALLKGAEAPTTNR
jgi:hypothetical protein